MKLKTTLRITLPLIITVFLFACKKDWLDGKPDQALVTLNTIKDLQALLDNTSVFNIAQPIAGEQSSDNYYITNTTFQTLEERDKNVYTWATTENFYAGSTPFEWQNPYTAIFYANTIIEEINKISPTNSINQDWENVKGSALFYRAYSFYNLAQLFCKPYITNSSNSDAGIILRLESDINIPSTRSTVQQTYDRIISDLKESIRLLPLASKTFATRPARPAAYAMLSRVYLMMSNYDESLKYSDSCLNLTNILMDYSNDPNVSLSSTIVNSIKRYNPEVLFQSRTGSAKLSPTSTGSGIIDTTLFRSFAAEDWRKTVFFRTVNGRTVFRGSYDGSASHFNGLSTNEIYLNRAECNARKGKITEAMQDLNALLVKRYKKNMYVPYSASNELEALTIILSERRKELCFRMLRWPDLRRLNQDSRFANTITRLINNQQYTLAPNDNKYTLPIPINEIGYSNIQQNPR